MTSESRVVVDMAREGGPCRELSEALGVWSRDPSSCRRATAKWYFRYRTTYWAPKENHLLISKSE